jgi:hypothetical protein
MRPLEWTGRGKPLTPLINTARNCAVNRTGHLYINVRCTGNEVIQLTDCIQIRRKVMNVFSDEFHLDSYTERCGRVVNTLLLIRGSRVQDLVRRTAIVN